MMRTTLTLDDDVAALLKERCHARDESFKAVVNEILRVGLDAVREEAPESSTYAVKPFKVGRPRNPAVTSSGELLAMIDEREYGAER